MVTVDRRAEWTKVITATFSDRCVVDLERETWRIFLQASLFASVNQIVGILTSRKTRLSKHLHGYDSCLKVFTICGFFLKVPRRIGEAKTWGDSNIISWVVLRGIIDHRTDSRR